jgi:uncharacterized protein (UPF0332 family)
MKNTETFKTKSEESLKAAVVLINNKLFNSSVHCSYYACVQLLNYILEYSENSNVSTLRIQIQDAKTKANEANLQKEAAKTKEEREQSSTEYKKWAELAGIGQDSHILLINRFFVLLGGLKADQKDEARSANKFNNDILYLKKLRKKADYTEEEISDEKANRCFETAKQIITNLKQHYQIQ